MNISKKKKNHKARGKEKSSSTQLFISTLQKSRLGKILLEEAKQPALMTNILGKQKLHMFSFYSTKNKEETKSFLNLSVTFPYARRQTMPKLSLDINGSKQQNAGPWCFNYSLFRGYACKKLQEHNFPARIIFCRLLQRFYLNLFDLYLQKNSIHYSCFSYIHLLSVSHDHGRGWHLCRAPHPAQAQPEPGPGLHPVGFWASPPTETPQLPAVSDNPHTEGFFQCLSGISCISIGARFPVSFLCIPSRRTCLYPLYIPSWGIYIPW